MANLIRKRGSSPLARVRRDADLEPQSGWDDYMSPRGLRREIDRLFDDFFSTNALNLLGSTRQFVPSLELSETDDAYVMKVELPGLSDADVHVEVDDDNMLTIRGEKKSETAESRGGYEYSERSYGEFVRTVQLPAAVEASKIEASFENGVLEHGIPKTEKAHPRAIPIGKAKAEPKKMVEEVSVQKTESGNGAKPPETPPQQPETSPQQGEAAHH